MATDKTPANIRGLLIPDPRFKFENISESDSSYSENSPNPGVPQAAQNSDAAHVTSGTQLHTDDITIRAQASGFAGTDAGTFLWHDTTDTATLKDRGWEPPVTITGAQIVEQDDPATQTYFRTMDTLTADDDSIIVAAVKTTSTGGSGSPLTVWRAAAGGTWSQSSIEIDSALEDDFTIVSANHPYAGPALVKLPDGRILLFYWISLGTIPDGAGGSTESWQIRAQSSSDNGVTWSLYQQFCLKDALVQLSSNDTDSDGGRYKPGRLRAAYNGGQIVLFSNMLDTSTTTSQSQPSSATGIFGQWASSDMGSSFKTVKVSLRSTSAIAGIDVVAYGGGFVVLAGQGPYCRDLGIRTIGSAYSDIQLQTPIACDFDLPRAGMPQSLTSNVFEWYETAIEVDPAGNLHVCFNRSLDSIGNENWHGTVMVYSANGGESWHQYGGGYHSNSFRGDSAVYRSTYGQYDVGVENSSTHIRERLADLVMTWRRGQMVLICRYEKTDPAASTSYVDLASAFEPGIPDQAIHALFLGGYSNVTMGTILGAHQMKQRGTWSKMYVPFIEPFAMGSDAHNLSWLTTDSGTHTEAILKDTADAPLLKITTGDGSGNAGKRSYEGKLDYDEAISPSTTTSGSRTHVEFAVDVLQGGSVIADAIAVRIRNGNAAKAEYVALRFENTGSTVNLRIADIQGSAVTLGTIDLNTHGIKDQPEFRVLIFNKRIAVYGRAYTPHSEVREWKQIYHSASQELRQGTAGGSYAQCTLEWGHLVSGGSSTQNQSNWYKVQGGADDSERASCAVPRINDWLDYASPEDVGGREFASNPIYVKNGIKLRTVDGPAMKGETWGIRPRYDYPIESIHTQVSPSPRRVWRSRVTSSDVSVVWDLDSNAPGFFLGSTIGLYLGNINFRFFDIEGYDGAAWSVIRSVDVAQQASYLRNGDTVKPDPASTTGNTDSQYFHTYGSLVGSTFSFDHTATTPSLGTIAANSEGVFSATTTKQPALQIGEDVSAKPASGTGAIWAQNVAVLIHGAETLKYQKLRLKIPSSVGGVSNSTVGGYFQIGTALFGHLAGFGRQYSFGHKREMRTNTDLDTSIGGYRKAVQNGPARRAVRFTWVDPVDLSGMQGTRPTPDYVKSSTAAGKGVVASCADTPFLLQGLLDTLGGSLTPVVYLPAIATASAQSTVILNPNQMLYGRITTDRHQIENQIGDEWAGGNAGEVATATTIKIEEEL